MLDTNIFPASYIANILKPTLKNYLINTANLRHSADFFFLKIAI